MEKKIKNIRIIINPAAGIGESIAKNLAKEGVAVMVHGRNERELERVVNEITDGGGNAQYVQGDLTKDEEAYAIAEKTLNIFQNVDILINNAGVYERKTWMQLTPEEWMHSFNANVISMVRMIRTFVPVMRGLGWGRIILIGSVAGINPGPLYPDYNASKAANINMGISLAKELAGTGITVNTVSPGPIVTSRFQAMFHQLALERNWGNEWEEIEKRAVQEILPTLVGRFGKPEEVANLVTFLVSPLADFITGVNYRIDGGR